MTPFSLLLSLSGLSQREAAAFDEWQSLRITRRISRTDGIPAGLPYLTGWVQHYTILHDEVAAH